MTLADLITLYRVRADDSVEPYLASDSSVATFLIEAEKEAAISGRLVLSDECAVIDLEKDQCVYPAPEGLYEITHISLTTATGERKKLSLVSREELDRIERDWRDLRGEPQYAIQNDVSIRFVPSPLSSATVSIEGFRLPAGLTQSKQSKPEINEAHHAHLVDWALYRVFSIPDSEMFDQQRSDMAKRDFDRYFGIGTDCDLRRSTRIDEPQTVKPFWV